MKVSLLPLLFSASVLAQKPEQQQPNRKLTKTNPNQLQKKNGSGQRKLQKDPLVEKNKLRGSQLSSKVALSEVDSKNLTAVIHIGPMKTGSSAIQLSLGKVYSTLKNVDQYEDAGFAMDDGIEAYHMIGCFRPDAVPFTGRPDYFELSCHPDALEQVSRVADRNHNLMITAEYLTDPNTDLKKFKEFLKPWKNHRIVAYYRRYYDWLLSFHNQIYKQHESPVTRKSVPDFLQNEVSYHYFYEAMYLTKAIERYQAEGFNDVKVINLYDLPSHDVREPFYCSGLVNATATCNEFQEYLKTETPSVENPSTPLIYDDLAYYAKEMNLWNGDDKSQNVKNVAKAAQDYHNRRRKMQNKEHLYEFHDSGAFICPTAEVYNSLLETSLSIEKELFPEYYSKKGENEIIEHFNKLVSTKKFCHIDAKLILQNDKEWRNFFQGLSLKTE